MSLILIVDDEQDVRTEIGKGLRKSGYEVLTARDGSEGYRCAEESLPDLILLDIVMPNRDGFAMLQQLRGNEATSQIPVVMLSAKTDLASIFTAKELAATDYLLKPVDLEEIMRYVKRYVGEP